VLGCSLASVKKFVQAKNMERVVVGGKWLVNLRDLKKVHGR
jgi:hypothetical protein